MYSVCLVGIPAPQRISVGDRVRVKPSVQTPAQGWGGVTYESVGVVRGKALIDTCLGLHCGIRAWLCSVNSSVIQPGLAGEEITVDFPEHSDWMGCVSEMETAS